jgi:4-amino-4-deoxy-L-arabinose transferase-like glycosyltransferase
MHQQIAATASEGIATEPLAASPSLRARLRSHIIPLACVLGACAIGQAATLIQPLNIYQWPDARQYVAAAHGILTSLRLADPTRTFGYPLFLAGVFQVAGDHIRAIVLAQALLMTIAAVEVYALGLRTSLSRSLAALVAAMLGANIFILNWERLVLSETLSYVLIVTLFLALAGYLRTGRTSVALWVGLLSAAAILTRPIFIFLPVVLALVLALRALRLGRLRADLLPVGVILATAYGAVVLYMSGNALANGYFGLSDIGSINLFAKVFEAHVHSGMPLSGSSQRVAAFAADVQRFVAAGNTDASRFMHLYPQYSAQHYAIYGTYSTQVIAHHPLVFLRSALSDARVTWLDPQWLWAPNTVNPLWVVALLKLAAAQYHVYLLLPLLLVVVAVWAWRQPERTDTTLLLLLLASVAAQILMIGATDYAEQYRLRFPLDWAMLFGGWVLGIVALRWVWALAQTRLALLAGLEQRLRASTDRR